MPNDFTVVHDGSKWHLIGITHPCPEGFQGPESFSLDAPIASRIHEAEWQLFHAVSTGETLRDSLKPGNFRQESQILPSPARSGERPEIWAPICWKAKDEYVLLYAPNPLRYAVSRDLYQWNLCGTAFLCNDSSARDPNIMEKDGIYTIVYIEKNTLFIRESSDLRTYSDSKVLFECPQSVSPESPILKYIDGWYYLFYCIYDRNDRVNGAYDYRTYVHAAKTLEGLYNSPRVAALRAHAPELFQDEQGDWYIASAEWPNRGISIAPIRWKEYDPDAELEF